MLLCRAKVTIAGGEPPGEEEPAGTVGLNGEGASHLAPSARQVAAQRGQLGQRPERRCLDTKTKLCLKRLGVSRLPVSLHRAIEGAAMGEELASGAEVTRQPLVFAEIPSDGALGQIPATHDLGNIAQQISRDLRRRRRRALDLAQSGVGPTGEGAQPGPSVGRKRGPASLNVGEHLFRFFWLAHQRVRVGLFFGESKTVVPEREQPLPECHRAFGIVIAG